MLKLQFDPFPEIPLQNLIIELSKSVSGRSLLDLEFKLSYDKQNSRAAYYRTEATITLPPGRELGELLVLLVVQLRKAQQPAMLPQDFDPDDAILVNRVIAFDALTFAIKVANELALSGYETMWKWIQSHGPMATAQRIYEIEARGDFRKINTGEAHRKCFDKFFERTMLIDKAAIWLMLHAEYISIPARRKVKPIDLVGYGILPNGSNYIALKPVDLKYSTVENRSNTNFLWFIKFERSFHKKAEEMAAELPPSCQIIPFKKNGTT